MRTFTTDKPPCSVISCDRHATHADPDGVGWCWWHRSAGPFQARDLVSSKDRPFNPTWAAESVAYVAQLDSNLSF